MPVIRAHRAVLPDRIVDHAAVEVDDRGRVVAVRTGSGPASHHTLIPGLVDLQVNGHDDVDVASARHDDWERLDRLLLAQGVTAWCPTLVTAPLHAYEAPLRRIADAAARPGAHPEVLGVHLEGPFLGGRPGAHPVDLVRAVDRGWLDALPPGVALLTVGLIADGIHVHPELVRLAFRVKG
ncbi:MAG: hypothetical protein KF703_17735, partial [Actinobacteria bacterium]|nr:hypothetical protein [Actinomycetota bacterium]